MMPLQDHKFLHRSDIKNEVGFTLIELAIVIVIVGLIFGLVASRTNTFSYWKEEGYIRNLSETINFLHHQSMVDQAFYRLEIDLKNSQYIIGVLKPEEESEELKDISSDIGNLSLELAAFLNPNISGSSTFIPPPSMPSLANPVVPPEGVNFEDVRTMRGMETEGKPYILFSPRGFSEFAVLHLRLSTGDPITILVNPFTGLTKTIREYKDFTWTYGRQKQGDS